MHAALSIKHMHGNHTHKRIDFKYATVGGSGRQQLCSKKVNDPIEFPVSYISVFLSIYLSIYLSIQHNKDIYIPQYNKDIHIYIYLSIFWECSLFNEHSKDKTRCAAGGSAGCSQPSLVVSRGESLKHFSYFVFWIAQNRKSTLWD